jgi:hypothetical protein
VNLKICTALILASILLPQAFAQDRASQGSVAHDKAVVLARHAAIEHGYHPENYSLLPSPHNNDLSAEGKEWFFFYVCKHDSYPGCAFSVTVSRTTGAVEVQPGE